MLGQGNLHFEGIGEVMLFVFGSDISKQTTGLFLGYVFPSTDANKWLS